MKRELRKIVSHETYSPSLIFLPIFLHLRRYPPTCMKTDRAAPLQQGCLAHVCAAFSPSSLPVFFLHASQNRPCPSAGEPSFRCFPCPSPLPGYGAAPDACPTAFSCRNIRLCDRPRASPSLSVNRRPAAFFAAPLSADFALFHMKHRLSLCFRHARFCRVFARSSSRIYAISSENPDFCLPSPLTTDLRLSSSRGSGGTSHDKPRRRSTRNRPARKPGRRAENARGGRRYGEQPGRDRPA